MLDLPRSIRTNGHDGGQPCQVWPNTGHVRPSNANAGTRCIHIVPFKQAGEITVHRRFACARLLSTSCRMVVSVAVTPAGKSWFPWFRFYDPEKAYLDKSWKMPDIERVS
jgi:hypothetical protein